MKYGLSLLAGVSMLALAGAANAGEPIQLTSDQMDGVTAGITNTWQSTYLSFYESVNIDKNVYSNLQLTGNLAFAEADATAYGSDTIAQSLTATYSDPYMSAATSTSISGSN